MMSGTRSRMMSRASSPLLASRTSQPFPVRIDSMYVSMMG